MWVFRLQKRTDRDDLFGKAAKRVRSKTHMEYLLGTATVMAFSGHEFIWLSHQPHKGGL